MPTDLTPDEITTLIDYARRKFGEERWPLSPELRPIRLLLEQLALSTERMPPPKPTGEPSLALRKKRR
jgi:hypothetical protein